VLLGWGGIGIEKRSTRHQMRAASGEQALQADEEIAERVVTL